MSHEELKILISAYADGEVTAAEKDIVETHLASCEECRKDLAAYKKLSSSLKQWPDERLSPDVEMKIARKSATKERTMKQETTIQWGAVVAFVGVVAVSLWGVQQYGQHALQARSRDAAIYFKGSNERFALSKVLESDKKREENFKAGQFKSSADHIGDQFTSASTARGIQKKEGEEFGQTVMAANLVGGKDTAMATGQLSAIAPAKSKDELSQKAQYEPYYLKSDISAARQNVQEMAAVSDMRVRGGQGAGYAVPASAPVAGGLMIARQTDYEYKRIDRPVPVYYYPVEPTNAETYDNIYENGFLAPAQDPLSTFSIDVDTASYSNVRRFLNQGQLPPQDAVRVEELVNYFTYDYPEPMWGQPFSITTEVAPCPWNPSHQLALIGIQGKRLNGFQMPASNLVFLIDVSGSMSDPNKLPLLQDAFRMMTQQLEAKDKVSIVVYAGAAGLVLDATPGNYKERILSAIDQLRAGGSTAGGAGIQLAYQTARANFIQNGNNRVILATDGDFNVGISNDNDLVQMIEAYRNQGIFLTVLGFGEGNLKDSKMEKLADKGNGNYFYIDTQNEARKVLVNELGSTLFTIAKDVKIQVEFNPATVSEYRLIGYENRMLAKEDFNDDTKDAGELGAGHTVTALYEIVPTDSQYNDGRVDPLVYQKNAKVIRGGSKDIMTVKLRYKEPKGDTSKLIKKTVGKGEVQAYAKSDNFRFASAVAEFGLLLRNSPYRGSATFDHVINEAQAAKPDQFGYRWEFIDLARKAQALNPQIMPLPVYEAPYNGAYDAPAHGVKSQK